MPSFRATSNKIRQNVDMEFVNEILIVRKRNVSNFILLHGPGTPPG